jgi:hypothetical protein
MTLGNCQAHWNQTLNGTYPKEEIRSLLIMALTDRFNWSAIDLITQKETVISSLDLEKR